MSKDIPLHILLVEDNETDVKIILRALQKNKLSCTIEIVGDGEDALRYLLHEGEYTNKKEHPDPDIVLLDVNMPRMDGHTFVRQIRSTENIKEIPIIVFTKKEGYRGAFRIGGVTDYVTKSIDGLDMVEKIREIMKFKQDFFKD